MKRVICALIGHQWGHWHYEIVTLLNITTGYNSCQRCGKSLVQVYMHGKV